MSKFRKKLLELGASPAAVSWVGTRSFEQAWRDCENAEWLMWICVRMVGQPGWPTASELAMAANIVALRVYRNAKAAREAGFVLLTAREVIRGACDFDEVMASGELTLNESTAESLAAGAVHEAVRAIQNPIAAVAAVAFAVESLAFDGVGYIADVRQSHDALDAANKEICYVLRQRLRPGEL